MQTLSNFRQCPPADANVSFPEEPLHLSGDQGFGFFPARAGLLLNRERYEILRKLGRGEFSSTWLVFDRCVVYMSATIFTIFTLFTLPSLLVQIARKAILLRHQNTDSSFNQRESGRPFTRIGNHEGDKRTATPRHP